jgi:membrane-associated protein
VLCLAAILGDSTGYLLGRQTGPRIFSRPDSRLFKQEYITRTKLFYEKYGGKTIIMARFLPIVRTFAAFVAGVGQMPYLRFLPYSVCGAVLWVVSLTTLGYQIGGIPIVQRNFDKVIVGIILLSLAPSGIELLRTRREKARQASS